MKVELGFRVTRSTRRIFGRRFVRSVRVAVLGQQVGCVRGSVMRISCWVSCVFPLFFWEAGFWSVNGTVRSF